MGDAADEVYLDWNATAPLHPIVIEAMRAAAAEAWGNPSSVHAVGRRARALVESAREAVAAALGFEARDTIFCSGATEANNLALGSAKALCTSRLEHPSVVRVVEALEAEGRPVVWLPVSATGRVDPRDVETALARLPAGAVVALQAANQETGVIQPVDDVGQLVRAARGRLHVDAAQGFGKLRPECWTMADSIAVAAHKVRGPKGIGALAFRPGSAPRPRLLGGPQERGLRPGTLDPVAAAGFRAAVLRLENGPDRYAALAPLRDRLEMVLARFGEVNGGDVSRLPHVSNVSFRGLRGDELVAALDLAGVRVASGSACSAGTTEPSSVIMAMHGPERARGAVRFSLGDATREADVERATAVVLRLLEKFD